MKLLLLDIGNTRSKLAWRKGQEVELVAAVENAHLLGRLKSLLSGAPGQLAMASVAPTPLAEQVVQAAQYAGWSVTQIGTERQRAGVTNSYQDVTYMGIDRWLAMVGAWQRCRKPLLVLDLGTALTADVLDADGQHLGGWIVPGFELMLQSLEQKTPRVFRGEAQRLATHFGRDTGACLQQGCRAALLGCMQLAYRQACEQTGQSVAVFVTGGGLQELPSHELEAGLPQLEHRPALVLEGLAACAESVLYRQ